MFSPQVTTGMSHLPLPLLRLGFSSRSSRTRTGPRDSTRSSLLAGTTSGRTTILTRNRAVNRLVLVLGRSGNQRSAVGLVFDHTTLASHINFSWSHLINNSILHCSIDQDDDSRAPHHRSNTMKKSMNRCVLLCRNQLYVLLIELSVLWGVDFLAVTVVQYRCTIVSCFYVFFGMFSTKLQLPFDFLFGLYLVDRMLTPHFVVILHWPFCTQLRGISSVWKLTL